ncbi:MAG: GNAT family N-acetyltransferase [Candidatus Izemoplasmatales bacterium]
MKESIDISRLSLKFNEQKDIRLEFTSSDYYPEKYEQNISGKLFYDISEDIDEELVDIGHFEAYSLNIGEIFEDQENLEVIMDDLGWDKLYYDLIYVDGEEQSLGDTKLELAYGDCSLYNGVFIITDLYINEKYRGNNIGLIALYTLLKFHRHQAGCVVLMLPTDKDNTKLMNYFSRLGFSQFEDSRFLTLSTAYRYPTIDEALYTDEQWRIHWTQELNNMVEEELYEEAEAIKLKIKKGRQIKKVSSEL